MPRVASTDHSVSHLLLVTPLEEGVSESNAGNEIGEHEEKREWEGEVCPGSMLAQVEASRRDGEPDDPVSASKWVRETRKDKSRKNPDDSPPRSRGGPARVPASEKKDSEYGENGNGS